MVRLSWRTVDLSFCSEQLGKIFPRGRIFPISCRYSPAASELPSVDGSAYSFTGVESFDPGGIVRLGRSVVVISACGLLTCACMQRQFHSQSSALSETESPFELFVDSGVGSQVDALALLAKLNMAHLSYVSSFGAVDRNVRVVVSQRPCRSVGYDPESRELVFCAQKGVENLGTRSHERVFREAFLAFFCHTWANFCGDKDVLENEPKGLASRLADHFAKVSTSQQPADLKGCPSLREIAKDISATQFSSEDWLHVHAACL